jgi:hypothetical protein
MEPNRPVEAALKQEALQKNDKELEAFLIDMQLASESSDEVQTEQEQEPKVFCTYSCQNRVGVAFNIILVLGLTAAIIFICVKMSLEN